MRTDMGRNVVLEGRVQPGKGDASRWLSQFNAAYSRKLGMAIFPGSLNVALPHAFDRHGLRAFLWSTTTAAQDRPDPWVVEVAAPVGLRATFGLRDGDAVVIALSAGGRPPRCA